MLIYNKITNTTVLAGHYNEKLAQIDGKARDTVDPNF